MENHEYNTIIGSNKAPYLNQLAAQGTLFTNYFAVTHPSLPNYLAITAGGVCGKTGSDGVSPLCSSPTIFTQLGSTNAQEYAENESGNCGYASTSGGLYVLRHDGYGVDSANRALSPCGDYPYSSLNMAALPEFSFITPNLCDDMHGSSGTCSSSVPQGDTWLSNNVPPLLAAGAIVIVTWDEGSSKLNGGGQVATIEAGAGVAVGTNGTFMNHYSLLAGLESYFGLPLLGNAATATPLPVDPGAAPSPSPTISPSPSPTDCPSPSPTVSPSPSPTDSPSPSPTDSPSPSPTDSPSPSPTDSPSPSPTDCPSPSPTMSPSPSPTVSRSPTSPPPVVADTFSRADGPLGKTELAPARTWYVGGTGTWAVASQKAVSTGTSSNGFAFVTIPSAAGFVIGVDITAASPEDAGLVALYVGKANYIFASLSVTSGQGSISVGDDLNGVVTPRQQASVPLTPGLAYRLVLARSGSTITATVSGGDLAQPSAVSFVLSTSDIHAFGSAAKAGMRSAAGDGGSTWDNFMIS